MKKISSVARDYFFLAKNAKKEVRNSKLTTLLKVVIEETGAVIRRCKHLSADFIEKAPWGIKRTIEQGLEIRDMKKYQNPHGPTYEYLYSKYQSMRR